MKENKKINADLWIDKYGNILFNFALVRVGNESVAEELVQETFVSALKSSESFEHKSSEKTWLVGILKHKIIDHFRKAKKTISYDRLLTECPDVLESSFDNNGKWKIIQKSWNVPPDKYVENKDLEEALKKCLNKLPHNIRKIFILREVDGVSVNEICEIFEISANNLYVILYRARNQLKICLEKNWFDNA